MVNSGHKPQDQLELLRGWQRSQLKLLKQFTLQPLVSQAKLSMASGSTVGSHELGGKITALTRADYIRKAGKDDDGKLLWELNNDKIDEKKLKEFLDKLGI